MITKGIRGAVIVEDNTSEAIETATLELLSEMVNRNTIDKNNISHVIFTLTKDIDAAFPAKYARKGMGWHDVAMMCFNEIPVKNAVEKCLRVLIVVNCEEDFTPKFVYLKGTENLRN